MEKILKYIGATCEVSGLDNKILFAGTIQSYDEGSDELTIALRHGDSTPQGVVYHTPLKLHIKNRGAGGMVLIYGMLERCAADYWKVQINHAVSLTERRESFRQPVSTAARVCPHGDKKAEEVCPVVDVSLTGLCFRSRQEYPEKSRLLVTGLRLRPEGAPHDFRCVVRRVEERDGEFYYGCAFEALSARGEDALFRDLFALQVKDINRK